MSIELDMLQQIFIISYEMTSSIKARSMLCITSQIQASHSKTFPISHYCTLAHFPNFSSQD